MRTIYTIFALTMLLIAAISCWMVFLAYARILGIIVF